MMFDAVMHDLVPERVQKLVGLVDRGVGQYRHYLQRSQNPDAGGVCYRSYAGAMRSWRSDVFMWWQNLIIGLVEGENDGLVTAESAQWTGFQGVWRGAAGRGVSHMDEVDFRRRPLRRRGEVFDVVDEYIRMAAQLKELGL